MPVPISASALNHENHVTLMCGGEPENIVSIWSIITYKLFYYYNE
jgi:hypothetical protein